jgi:hypothetical protein
MSELVGIVCGLAVILLVVMSVGHGLWVLFSNVLSSITRKKGSVPSRSPEACPRCLSPLPPAGSACAVCNWPDATVAPSKTNALAGLNWQVKRLVRLGILDAPTQDRLLQAISAERDASWSPTIAARGEPAILVEQPVRSIDPAAALVAARAATLPSLEAKKLPALETDKETRASEPAAELESRIQRYMAQRAAAASETIQPVTAPPAPREAFS